MKAHKILALLLAAALMLSCLPGSVLRVNAEESEIVTVTQAVAPEVELPDDGELYEVYLEKLFYDSGAVPFNGVSARSQLTPMGQKLYDYLKGNIQKIAAGEQESTVFTVGAAQLSDWGATVKFSVNSANAAFSAFMEQFEVSNVIQALLHDCPYELYWYDKVSGVMQSGRFSVGSGSYTVISATFIFYVSGNWQPEGYDVNEPTFDTSGAAAAVAASDKARAIVKACAGKSDYEILKTYKEEICELVSYDYAAASGGNFSADASAWQLIHVFDGDTTTNVVCEGYSKAFQYLCDLTDFNCLVSCTTVTGSMSGGAHMWNIVTIGAENYLADVTNSDTGTTGQNGSLFLAGTSGSVSDGYNFTGTIFRYDADTRILWGADEDSVLDLAHKSFVPPASGNGHVEEVSAGVEPSCTEAGLTAGKVCTLCGAVLQKQEAVSALGHDYGEWKTVSNPTCTADGQERRDCSRCDHYETRAGEKATGHTEAADAAVAATCTGTGLTAGSHCAVCKAVIKAQQTVPAKGHDMGDWETVTASSCTASGKERADCSACDHYETREVSPLGHIYETKVTAPTCAKSGYTTYTCSVCADTYKDDYKDATGKHTYVNDQDTTCDVCGHVRELKAETTPMYRLYNPNSGEHFYTGSVEEREDLVTAGWAYEGVAWNAPVKGGTPVHRVYNPNSGDHHYTMDQKEVDMLVAAGWKYEGVAWNSASVDNIPLFRLWNPNADCGSHHYTSSTEERDSLVNAGWVLEGIGWYGMLH